jgi:hypothetical protein
MFCSRDVSCCLDILIIGSGNQNYSPENIHSDNVTTINTTKDFMSFNPQFQDDIRRRNYCLFLMMTIMSMGVRLCLWTTAINGPIINPTGDVWVCSPGGMTLTGETWRTLRKTCISVTLFTTNPTWIDPGQNPGLRCKRPTTNHPRHGTARRHYHNLIILLRYVLLA